MEYKMFLIHHTLDNNGSRKLNFPWNQAVFVVSEVG